MNFLAENYHMQHINCHYGKELVWKYSVWGEERNNKSVVPASMTFSEAHLVRLDVKWWCNMLGLHQACMAHTYTWNEIAWRRNICVQWLNSMCMSRVRCVHVQIQKMCSENCADIHEQMKLNNREKSKLISANHTDDTVHICWFVRKLKLMYYILHAYC